MIKILIGGSPCTYWSIAQKNNRETEPSGLGWELFLNYCIAKEKFKPDIFLYENNKSAAQAIKDEIKKQLQVNTTNARYIEINSALVSAQNRQRFYVHNCGDVEQPQDRGVVLRDILETTTNEQGYEMANLTRIPEYGDNSKSRPINAHYQNNSGQADIVNRVFSNNPSKQQVDYIAEQVPQTVSTPVRIGDVGSDSQAHRVYSSYGKSVTINSGGGGQGGKTGLYACPVKCLNEDNVKTLFREYGSKGKILSKDSEKPRHY